VQKACLYGQIGRLFHLCVVGLVAILGSDRCGNRDSAVPIGYVVLKNECWIGLSSLSTNGEPFIWPSTRPTAIPRSRSGAVNMGDVQAEGKDPRSSRPVFTNPVLNGRNTRLFVD
jgi:hypothetical protein